ncbi:hypothetical protein ACVIU7_004253 [Bradyrhizobium liaoningense]
MADTMGHSATAIRNTKVALGFCLLAIAPQIFELIWSTGTLFGWGTGRGPATVVTSHVTALLAGAPAAIFGSFGGGTKKMSSEVLLALIYSYPLFAVAILTLFMTIRSAQDYVVWRRPDGGRPVRAVGIE